MDHNRGGHLGYRTSSTGHSTRMIKAPRGDNGAAHPLDSYSADPLNHLASVSLVTVDYPILWFVSPEIIGECFTCTKAYRGDQVQNTLF